MWVDHIRKRHPILGDVSDCGSLLDAATSKLDLAKCPRSPKTPANAPQVRSSKAARFRTGLDPRKSHNGPRMPR